MGAELTRRGIYLTSARRLICSLAGSRVKHTCDSLPDSEQIKHTEKNCTQVTIVLTLLLHAAAVCRCLNCKEDHQFNTTEILGQGWEIALVYTVTDDD